MFGNMHQLKCRTDTNTNNNNNNSTEKEWDSKRKIIEEKKRSSHVLYLIWLLVCNNIQIMNCIGIHAWHWRTIPRFDFYLKIDFKFTFQCMCVLKMEQSDWEPNGTHTHTERTLSRLLNKCQLCEPMFFDSHNLISSLLKQWQLQQQQQQQQRQLSIFSWIIIHNSRPGNHLFGFRFIQSESNLFVLQFPWCTTTIVTNSGYLPIGCSHMQNTNFEWLFCSFSNDLHH